MYTVRQDFFDKFKCIAGDCPCTCCSGWQIVVDDASLERYGKYKGKLKDSFKNSIDFEEGTIYQCENGDCAFLNKEGLCDMIIAEGDSILCDTCRLYPRHVEEYEDTREWSMSLSCPEIARIVVESDVRTGFISKEDDEPDPLEDDFDDFDLILFTKLIDSREVIFNYLKDEKLTIEEKIGLITDLSEKLQIAYDNNEDFKMDDIISEYGSDEFVKNNKDELAMRFSGFIRMDFDIFNELERLSEDFDDLLSLIKYYPYSKADGMRNFIEGISEERHELIIENILNSFLYTYYPGSIYNGMIYAYTEMCIFLTIAIDSLALCKSIREGRRISLKEYEETVYRVCRETEHSDVNINTMLEYFDLPEEDPDDGE